MKIVNDDSRVFTKLETSLTDNARVIIYDHNMFIVQATGVHDHFSKVVLSYPNLKPCHYYFCHIVLALTLFISIGLLIEVLYTKTSLNNAFKMFIILPNVIR